MSDVGDGRGFRLRADRWATRFGEREPARAGPDAQVVHATRTASFRAPNNERLEFLGDAVLGFVVGEMIYRSFPNLQEGALSKIKAHLVSANMLAAPRDACSAIGRFLRMGTGEARSGGAEKLSLLADAFEAVVAAIYLDGGAAGDGGVPAARLRARGRRHRHRRPLLPRLQDHAPGDGPGPGPAAARVPGRRGVGSRPREGLHGRAPLGRDCVLPAGAGRPSARLSARRRRKR